MSNRLLTITSHIKSAEPPTVPTAAVTVTVCGGGNAAHVMAGDLGSRGYTVNLYLPFRDEAERFKAALPSRGLKINYTTKGRVSYSKPGNISKNAEDVIPGAKFIFIPLPVFAHEPTLMNIVPHCDDDAVIVALPATGCFDWTATKVFKKLGKCVTIAGIAPLPYVCRIATYGAEVNLMGIKHKVGMATLPSNRIHDVANVVEEVIGLKVERFPSFVPITLTPTNPIMHTARLYGMFVGAGNWRDRKGYPTMIKFYDDCDDVSNEWIHRLNDENQKIAAAIEKAIPGCTGGKIRSITDFLKWAYGPDITNCDTAGDCYRSNSQFRGVGSPMLEVAPGYLVPDFKNRYFAEDFPFGLLANRGLAELLGVPTPDMDTVIEWAQKEMGKQWIVDGKLNPNEKPQMTPQAFGFSLEDIRKMYSL